MQKATAPVASRVPEILLGSLLALMLSAGPVEAQSSGVTVAVQGGYDVMSEEESGVAAEVLAGYRWESRLELLAGFGMKFRERGFSCPAVPGAACSPPEGLENDYEHRFAEARYWFGNWETADPPAAFLGVRLGWTARRTGGFSSRGPTYGVTAGGEFGLTPSIAIAPLLILDIVDAGEERSATSHYGRLGLRLGLRALIGGG